MSSPVQALMRRDWQLAVRRPTQALLPLVFFVVAASLFPLGVGPEPQMLRTIAPGVVWVCALLAAMMSLGSMYAMDHQDGTLEQYVLCGQSLSGLALGKALVHWVIHGLPLVLVSPIMALAFGMPGTDEEIKAICTVAYCGIPTNRHIQRNGSVCARGLTAQAYEIDVCALAKVNREGCCSLRRFDIAG